MLRCNFAVLADMVLDQDAHLLDSAEKDLIAKFKVSHLPATVHAAQLRVRGNSLSAGVGNADTGSARAGAVPVPAAVPAQQVLVQDGVPELYGGA